MPRFSVSWHADIEAKTPQEAAETARRMHRRSIPGALVFTVEEGDGTATVIDLGPVIRKHREETDGLFGRKQHHPSFAVACLSKPTGLQRVFGSAATHRQTVSMEIKRATVSRNLSDEWIFGDETLLELSMSEAQWAQLVSSFGSGGGVPVTLRYVDGEGLIDAPPAHMGTRQTFSDEIKAKVDAAVADARTARQRLEELLQQKTVSKADLRGVVSALDAAVRGLAGNAPFVLEQFEEATEKMTAAAKIEIEAYQMARVYELGMKALGQEVDPEALARLANLSAGGPVDADPVEPAEPVVIKKAKPDGA